MNINITGRQMDVTEALKSAVHRNIDKLAHLLDFIQDIHVILAVEKINHLAEMTITTDNGSFFSEVRTEDMYESIDRLFEKAERQIKKFREKLQDHKQITPISHIFSTSSEGVSHANNPISKVEEIAPKPMTVHEAILQMNLDHRDFYIFLKENNHHELSEAVLMRKEPNTFSLISQETEAWLKHELSLRNEHVYIEDTTDTHLNELTLMDAIATLPNVGSPYLLFFDVEMRNLNILYFLKNNKLGLLTSNNALDQQRPDRFVM